MPYNSYYPATYQPMYPSPVYQPTTQQQAQATAQPQTTNRWDWVQGETGAKSYLVAPNTTVLLLDSENQRFYLKSADTSGMPMPLRVFEFTETTQTAQLRAGQVAEVDALYDRLKNCPVGTIPVYGNQPIFTCGGNNCGCGCGNGFAN